MKRIPHVQSFAAGAALLGALLSAPALAQNEPAGSGASAPASASPDRGTLLDDFLHYVLTAKPDLASANGRALLDSGITDAELAELVDSRGLGKRVEDTLRRGRSIDGIEDLMAEFETRLETGRQDLSRNPQRIEEAISMLVGNLRGQMQARSRLQAAGDYAVPGLLRVIVGAKGPDLELAATDMLKSIGRQAVTPLAESLTSVDANTQRKICDILGDIGYPHAAPYLAELAADPNATPPVREAASRAFGRVGGGNPDPSAQFAQLAANFFSEQPTLIPWPGEEANNVWTYDPTVGLAPTPVPSTIFSEVMSMRSARRALTADSSNAGALALYVASNLKRENELQAGQIDPIFGQSTYTPQFFATASGTTTARDVLALALDAKNTPLIRDAIAALAQTTGGGNLLTGSERQPLLESLRYPDRRVQYEAALTLARALPTQTFSGSEVVVPMLASAVRTGATSYALVIADDAENRRLETSRLQALGFTVLSGGATANEAMNEIAAAHAIDLVVVRAGADTTRQAVAMMRTLIPTSVAPVLVIAAPADRPSLASTFETDGGILVWQPAGDEAFAAAVETVMTRASGGRISESEADQYAFDALEALQMIAVANSGVYSIADAENSLLEALASRSGGVRLVVADVLARIDSARSQRALFDAALGATEREQIELLDHAAASARRFGNKSEARHADALLQLVSSSTGETADAAARLHGALNLPTANAVKLITN